MATDCMYFFVHKEPIRDPYGWLQNLSMRTGCELTSNAKCRYPSWIIDIDIINDDLTKSIRKYYTDQGYISLKKVEWGKATIELVIHQYIGILYTNHLVYFNDSWDIFLAYARGVLGNEVVQQIQTTIVAIKELTLVLDALGLYICSEYVYDEILELTTDNFVFPEKTPSFIFVSQKDLEKGQAHVKTILTKQPDTEHNIFRA
ncbi:hypothetical protein [Gracilinema caldarium]|uniref:Uncharacterized protein n=1 Tax=Gracilinema caldarium (strain ATCC 51460 / DSM 7334 / H1) TaxID=744872 RepID=F8F431_GRAC1|nr:hypothetical protein [Gracilinema caldarium]AEJ20050.1 hypothetical protein Spica_1918 [Gracilinema caldarium DSM 7334]